MAEDVDHAVVEEFMSGKRFDAERLRGFWIEN
jgi:hypothetical protein